MMADHQIRGEDDKTSLGRLIFPFRGVQFYLSTSGEVTTVCLFA